jgi:hypothetical protein
MNGMCERRGSASSTFLATLLVLGVGLALTQPGQAAANCPIRLSGGAISQGTVTFSFMNQGKTPVRELHLDCTRRKGQKMVRTACHSESGVFYPGNPYSVRFDDTDKVSHPVEVIVESARFQDGGIWTSSQDVPCKALKLASR